MKSDVRPSNLNGLHRRPADGRRSHAYATATAATSRPRRRKKKLGELVQKLECAKSEGWKDPQYAAIATVSPPTPSPMLTRISVDGSRASSINTPTNAPAGTNAIDGNAAKCVRFG